MKAELGTLLATMSELAALMGGSLCVLNLPPMHEYLGALEASVRVTAVAVQPQVQRAGDAAAAHHDVGVNGGRKAK